jgi:hypothetical protein
MNKQALFEYQNPSAFSTEIAESVDSSGQKRKDLYMKGIFIQGDVRNHNQRVYPVYEISKAVDSINQLIKEGVSVFGELDHPADLKINLDRVSHVITSMWMEGANGHGKLKMLPTPMGNIIRSILESDVKLGVSSRGSGNVNESTGTVSDFEIITVDIVAQPSAPSAFPKPVYEALLNMRNGHNALELSAEATYDPRVQKYLTEYVTRLIKDLKKN